MIEEKFLKMEFKKEGEVKKPLKVFIINDSYILAVYQGSLSELDLLIKYRQKIKNDKNTKWSRIRTPKHIHWAVDILIKMAQKKDLVKEFLNILIDIWDRTKSHQNHNERDNLLMSKELPEFNEEDMKRFNELNNYGEYNVRFLILLAKLLMQQEKNNMYDAYMFKNLLDSLKKGEDIFRIVYTATHTKK